MQNGAMGKGVASMVLGILSLVLCYVPVLGFILAAVGLPLGASAMRGLPAGQSGRGMAVAGVVMGIIGLILGVLVILGIAFAVVFGISQADSYLSYYPYASSDFVWSVA